MKIIKKITSALSSILYALPFGMKAADEMITTSQQSDSSDVGIHQSVERKSVLRDLLNGEVTQEVEELRWEMFKAEELANDYTYIGNGQSVKTVNEETKKKNRKHFTQENFSLEYSVQESMKMVEEGLRLQDEPPTRKLIQIEYDNPNVRFKLEKRCAKVEVIIDNDKKNYVTKLFFVDSPTDKKARPFLNFLKKTEQEISNLDKEAFRNYSKHNEICSEIKELSFSTYRASNNVPNGIFHKFTQPSLSSIKIKDDKWIILEYKWKEHEGDILLSQKYSCPTAEEKFKNKEKREGYVPTIQFG